jgi:uncharacterized protein with GYD domain
MATFCMFGDYTYDSVKEISAERTTKAAAAIGACGGTVKAGYVMLGEHDILLIVEFSGIENAIKASVELTKLLGISFTTAPAVTVDEFDRLIEGG